MPQTGFAKFQENSTPPRGFLILTRKSILVKAISTLLPVRNPYPICVDGRLDYPARSWSAESGVAKFFPTVDDVLPFSEPAARSIVSVSVFHGDAFMPQVQVVVERVDRVQDLDHRDLATERSLLRLLVSGQAYFVSCLGGRGLIIQFHVCTRQEK